MMKNEKKSESEIEWEKEYNLRKAKRKWLLNKKKSELLALIQGSNALSKIKVMFCVVGFVVLILFVVVVFVFLFNIFLNYNESRKYRVETTSALIKLESGLKKSIGRRFIIKDSGDESFEVVLSSCHINGDVIECTFSPGFTRSGVHYMGLDLAYGYIVSELSRLKLLSAQLESKSELNTFVCDLLNPEDMKALLYGGKQISYRVPDLDESSRQGSIVYTGYYPVQIRNSCSLDVRTGFLSGVKSL